MSLASFQRRRRELAKQQVEAKENKHVNEKKETKRKKPKPEGE